MAFSIALRSAVTLIIGSSFASAAFAGGLDRGGYDIDLLFDKGRYVFESGVTYVMPDRKLKNAKDINPADRDKPSSEGPDPKRWKDIWSAGHSVSGVGDVPTVTELVARTAEEYDAACRSVQRV